MSEEDQHINKRSTGTVPKQRIRYTRSVTEVDRLRSLSNSSTDYYHHDSYNELRSPRRSNQIIDSNFQTQGISPVQTGSINVNSVGSSNPSSTTSRKNSLSSTLKCDNITKHPNKKQIEDKLNEIHEYLKVTNSLMASIKKVDNQVQNDDFVIEGIDGNLNLEHLGLNLITLKDHDSSLLQRKSENKRSSPKQTRSNLLLEVCNHMNSSSNRANRNEIYFESNYKDHEEKNRRLHPIPQLIPTQDKTILNMEDLHNLTSTNINENVELFDTIALSDVELSSQHDELHKQIVELQNRKFQIDQFIAHLQRSGGHGEDVEHQMMKICAMKAQLKKLQNMLEIAKMPLNMEYSNPDFEKASCYLCSTTNIGEKIKSGQHNDSNIFRSAGNSGPNSRSKQLNKNSIDKSKLQPTKTNVSSVTQKSTLQTELESKKRELVEIMEKHKVNPSNLNQDLGVDTKSDISFLTNGINDPWTSVISNDSDSERFSSDEYQNDINEEVKHNFLPSPKFSSSNITNSQTENSQRSNFEFRPVNRGPYTPETNYRSNSIGATMNKNKSQMTNSQDMQANQMQKQLEMIRSMCDTMLEQQNNQETYSNQHQQPLQNNQTYSSQRFASPHQQNSSRNSDSGINSEIQMPLFPTSTSNNNATNSRQDTTSIQTQSFMLNTLNQCYQMLWLQQKELATLKNSVLVLQERLNNSHSETSLNAPIHVVNASPLQQQPDHKINQDAYNIPVNNQFDCPLYFNSVNNTSTQLLDSCLNNINLNRLNVDQNNEHVIPANINHLMPNHIWSGQALNNQVVPGNRANNYWDNFRSYSRQNLLSTKNSEVLQNLPTVVDRPNFINQCANPFAFMSFSKSNSEQGSINTSQDNTFQRMSFKETNPGINLGPTTSVIAVNDTIKNNEEIESPSKDIFHKDNNSHFGLPLAPNLRTNREYCPKHCTLAEELLPEQSKDKNTSTAEEACHCLKSTFEDMKENIYKEVASLISANENRPQFLIQLFRDLQLVKSDNVRENVLHSIERNISNSHIRSTNSNTQTISPTTYLQSTSSPDLNNVSGLSSNDVNIKNIIQVTQLFLYRHEECTIQNNFLISLNEFLLNLQSFKEIFNDKSCRIDFIKVLDNDLQKYCGRKLAEIKLQIFQRIQNMVYENRQLVYLVDETNSKSNDAGTNITFSDITFKTAIRSNESGLTPTNEDLAEADQSRIVIEDFSEEGAVGGILDTSQIRQTDDAQIFDPVSFSTINQATLEPTNRELYQSTEESETLEIRSNNSISLDK